MEFNQMEATIWLGNLWTHWLKQKTKEKGAQAQEYTCCNPRTKSEDQTLTVCTTTDRRNINCHIVYTLQKFIAQSIKIKIIVQFCFWVWISMLTPPCILAQILHFRDHNLESSNQ
ncbi:hypothetical protein AAHE18_05G210700 [Arachis hypogaea]